MSRAERRMTERNRQKLRKELDKLTPNQIKLVDKITEHKANEILDVFKKMINESVFEAMRNNRISKERTLKIMEETNSIMIKKLQEDTKAVS